MNDHDPLDVATIEASEFKASCLELMDEVAGEIEIPGDIIEPLDVEWEANR